MFQARLLAAGWVDSKGIVLKPFDVSYRGREEEGAFYVEWKAILEE